MIFRTARVLSEGGQFERETFADFEITGAGLGTQAYSVQKTLPDRHTWSLYRTDVRLSSRLPEKCTNRIDMELHLHSREFSCMLAYITLYGIIFDASTYTS